MSSILEEFVVKLGFEVDEKKIDKFRDNLRDISKGFLEITGLASLAQLSIGALAHNMQSGAAQMGYTAESLGISTDRLQQWSEAADAAGASGDSIMNAMLKVNKALGSLSTDNPDIDFLTKNARKGIDVQGLKDAEQYFFKVEDHLKGIKDYQTRLSTAMDLGFSEKDMLLLQKGSEFTKKFFTQDYVAYSKEYIKASKEITASIHDTETSIKQLGAAILVELAPAIKEIIANFQEWMKTNDGLIKEDIKIFVSNLAKAMALLAHNINLVLGALVAIYAPSVIAGINTLTTALKANPAFAAVAGVTALALNNYSDYKKDPNTTKEKKGIFGFIEHNLEPENVFKRYEQYGFRLKEHNNENWGGVARDVRTRQPLSANAPITNTVNVTVQTNASDPQAVASLVNQNIRNHLDNVTRDIYQKNKSQVIA